jgi:glycosyltransferase involved in cell wall biosynthesis
VKKAGYKLVTSSAFVLHAGSRTLTALHGDIPKLNEKYQRKLVDKWGKEWTEEHAKLSKKVLIVSYSAEEWSRGSFFGSLLGLKRSDGHGFSFHRMERAPIHLARQLAADYALDSGFDYLVQLDDDATFPSDLVRRFLAHDKDVVTALAYQRKPPYNTCLFEVEPGGLMGSHIEGWEHTGLRRVDVSGFHCSMMKTRIFKKLRDAGIRQYYGGFDNKLGEDFSMCVHLKKIDVPVYCDTDIISGHLGASIHIDEFYKKLHQAGKAP